MDTGERTYVAEVVLPWVDIADSVEFYTEKFGFRVERSSPADSPSVAELSGEGVRLRLEDTGSSPSQTDTDGWATGRAGMQYRDLLPERGGGRYVVSPIRVPGTGPVQDYSHFHRVQFRMIFCLRGWAKLVYEHQGPHFVMSAGDCVFQPPEIRHRVIETGDSLEVIEVTSPAVHDTFGDHHIVLGSDSDSSGHLGKTFLAILLSGGAVLDCDGTRKVVAGDAFSVPAKSVARLHQCAHEFEALVVRLPSSEQVGAST